MKNIRAVAPVIGEVRVGHTRRGRHEIRPAGKFLRELVIEHDPRDAFGLLRDIAVRRAKLVGESLAVLVDVLLIVFV